MKNMSICFHDEFNHHIYGIFIKYTVSFVIFLAFKNVPFKTRRTSIFVFEITYVIIVLTDSYIFKNSIFVII